MTGQTEIVAVASGKGGVGKTWLSITLAHAACLAGRSAIILDGDIGLANVDIQAGISPRLDLSAWAQGDAALAEIVHHADAGFDVIPGASGSSAMAGLGAPDIARLIGDFRNLASAYDLGLIDISAGVEAAQIRLAGAAGRCLLVITEDPTALTDGYAFVKLAQRLKRPPRFGVVVNMAESKESGVAAYKALAKATTGFLKVEPALVGVIRRDPAVAGAIRRQTPLLAAAPHAPAADDARAILASILAQPRRAA